MCRRIPNGYKTIMNARYQTLILTAALLATAGPAAADIFLELKDPQGILIKGESTDPDHKDKIVIEGFSLDISSTTGKVTFAGLQLSKKLDRTSPLLYLHCAQGSHLQEATLFVTKRAATGEQSNFYTIKMTDVQVSSVQTGGENQQPTEQFSLTCAAISFSYSQLGADGRPLGIPVTSKVDFGKSVP